MYYYLKGSQGREYLESGKLNIQVILIDISRILCSRNMNLDKNKKVKAMLQIYHIKYFT